MSSLVVSPGNTDRGGFTNFDSFANGTNGLKIIDGAADSASAFSRGDWIEGTINGVSAALDVVGMILNPLGTACSMVINWIIEHCGPLQDWLDELMGDPGVIMAGVQTWSNVGDHMGGIGPDHRSLVDSDTGGFTGLSIDAYRAAAGGMVHVFDALSKVGLRPRRASRSPAACWPAYATSSRACSPTSSATRSAPSRSRR